MIKYETQFIKGSASIADLFKEKNRCGIYVLDFESGEKYVGKTKDVVQRYSQHRKTHRDIQAISFHEATEDKLDSIEVEAIKLLEAQRFKLRNIALMSDPYFKTVAATRSIDLVMTPKEQEQWLNGKQIREKNAERRINTKQREKYDLRIKKLEKKVFFNPFIDVLRTYFEIGIPYPERTEYSSYSVTCLPAPRVYSRININMQEIFTAFEIDEFLGISLHVAKSPLKSELASLKRKYTGLVVRDHKYKPGGDDQICLSFPYNSELKSFLKEPAISIAIRTMNLRLMRRGANIYSASHCPQLVDLVLNS